MDRSTNLDNMPIISLIKCLWQHISKKRRVSFCFLLLLIILTSFAEIFSIGAVIPFIGVLVSPEKIFNNPLLQPYIADFGISSPDELLFPTTLAFTLCVFFAGIIRLLLIWANTRLSFATGADLGISMYRRTLYQPYRVHVSRNSSEIISGISSKVNDVIYQTIIPILNIIAATVMLLFISLALLYVNPAIAIAVYSGLFVVYFSIIFFTRKRLKEDSNKISVESTNLIKSLQEGLGGIRDILIDGSQPVYCDIYNKSDLALRRAQARNLFTAQSPRYSIETIGILILAIFAYTLAKQPNGISNALPIIGVLALAAQRLLPILQLAYQSWSSILGGQASLRNVITLLEQPISSYITATDIQDIPFEKNIDCKEISFKYSDKAPTVLTDVTLSIKKNSMVGIIGTTGSGKSTLLDILMGLLEPTNGAIYIDDKKIDHSNYRSWQKHISHVPQSIFLSDATIAENIAFGVEKNEIDYERVKMAAQKAEISATIELWEDKYHTKVGERGVRLSGGQRQRIGIARALYKKADVLILDEATSALDDKTEESIMNSIEKLRKSLTIIIVAHRITTLKKCDKIIELDNSMIKRICSFAEI